MIFSCITLKPREHVRIFFFFWTSLSFQLLYSAYMSGMIESDIYVYIYRERDGERERKREREREEDIRFRPFVVSVLGVHYFSLMQIERWDFHLTCPLAAFLSLRVLPSLVPLSLLYKYSKLIPFGVRPPTVRPNEPVSKQNFQFILRV